MQGNSGLSRVSLLRLVPFALLLCGLAAFFILDLGRFVSFEALRQHRQELMALVDAHPVSAPLVYACLYVLVVAFSLPVASLLTIIGGFLFGPLLGTLLVVGGATLGATLVYLAARTALGDLLRAKAGPSLRKLEDGFRENAFNYLLFLRLIPLFPFWLVNLAPAFLGVGLRTFVLGTALGIIPGSFVFVYVGQGLGAVLEAGENLGVQDILSPEIMLAFGLLAILALAPVVYRKLKSRIHG